MKAGFVFYAVYDFSIRLSQNGTVKQLGNQHRASRGHVKKESGGIFRKQFYLYFLLIF